MQNYDFKNLNDKEFEVLVNDLISKREAVNVDRFKPGKDGGVDGRFFLAGSGEAIIQSKHWLKSGIKPLIRRLKQDEVSKVKKLNPKKYIIATSLELSRTDKQEIKKAFAPYIISENDILGQENLNCLLAEHSDIEQKHYKLWLSSSNIQMAMLNNALTGRSEALRDKIIAATKLYVVTDNHNKALNKLKNLHSVIITGEAGIGKTSLAEQLAHHYVGHGFELCAIENDISEAENIFKKNEKQVFYFDDFLGRNFLMAIDGNKDSHILNFMERVSKDSSKRFILTSRSTVLQQAKEISDLLGIKKIDKKEYEITVQSLSNLDRAKILYNHIWYSDLKEEYIEEIYIEKRYSNVVKHRNFNPRIISFITDPDRFEGVPPHKYWGHILDKLNNPADIWKNVFDDQIDDLTRMAVCLVVFNGATMDEDKLRDSFFERAIADGIVTASNANNRYTKMLNAAVGSMLKRTIFELFNSITIDLFNPSVADFILGRYLEDRHSLKAYFSCLNSMSSLHNLKSLKDTGHLKDDIYYDVLQEIAVGKINSNCFDSNTKYILTLVHIIITDTKALSQTNVAKVLQNIQTIDSISIPFDFIEKTCDILKFALSKQPKIFKIITVNFIINSLENYSTGDDLMLLHGLMKNIECLASDEETKLRESIENEIEAYWEENIHEEIRTNNILNDYMFVEDRGTASKSLCDYLYDKLFELDFSEDRIYAIAEHADISEILSENMEISARESEPIEGRISPDRNFSENSDVMIDDLFQR